MAWHVEVAGGGTPLKPDVAHAVGSRVRDKPMIGLWESAVRTRLDLPTPRSSLPSRDGRCPTGRRHRARDRPGTADPSAAPPGEQVIADRPLGPAAPLAFSIQPWSRP